MQESIIPIKNIFSGLIYKLKLYWAYIKMRMINELQYKGAAIAGVITQFAWGSMYIMLYTVFLKNGTSSDYTIPQMCTYIWLHQAFLRMFNLWSTGLDEDVLMECQKGDIAIELVRPIKLYYAWHARTFGKKIAKVTARAIPIFIVCSLPFLGQYKLTLPVSGTAFIFFVITLILAAFILMAYTMILYICMMRAMTAKGLTVSFQMVMELCSGSLIPIAFMPEKVVNILKYTPFYYMQNTTFNIYNGYISDINEIYKIVLIQIVWLVIMTVIGKVLMKKQISKVIVQGG